ncbi:hypothetical protein ACT7DF_12915 [Bacillus cereus]
MKKANYLLSTGHFKLIDSIEVKKREVKRWKDGNYCTGHKEQGKCSTNARYGNPGAH